MNLLPKSKVEFSNKSYWESFFEKRKDAFEWYGEYFDLCELLDKYCKTNDNILMSGCGNSNLSENMYDVGYHDIVNIDISDVVVRQMSTKSKSGIPYLKMDMKETTFDEENFNVVIDKGTLDAIYSHDDINIAIEVEKMFTEILRVLKVFGRYICITLAQDHILNILLSFFSKCCFVRVHEIEIKKNDEIGGFGSRLPVFCFVCTKMKSELTSPCLEMCFSGNDRIEKLKVIDDIKRNIKALQDFALIKTTLENCSLHEEITVDLWANDELLKEPRYSLTVVDTAKNELSTYNGEFAVFIVPNGRQNNKMFATKSGRSSLAETAGFSRLIVAFLHRGHRYKDLEQIKSELSGKVMDFAPSNMDKSVQVPFLSTSSDIGNRVVSYEGESSLYGKFLIEDIKSEEQYYYRQLVFLNKTDEIQSKIRLMLESNKKKKSKKRIPDHRYMMQIHEKGLMAGFSFLSTFDVSNMDKKEVLIFGLRSASFISCLLHLFPNVHVTCVEVDSNIHDITKTWFRLNDMDRLSFISNDINRFPDENFQSTYDVVVVDQMRKKDDAKPFVLTDDIFTKINGILKHSGALMDIEQMIDSHEENVKVVCSSPHFEFKADDATISIYVKSNDTLVDTWEHAKCRCKKIVDYIMGKEKGFYEKQEWSSLVNFIDNSTIL